MAGGVTVESLTYTNQAGESQTLAVEGVFVTIGAIPNTDPLADLLPLDKFKAIPADRCSFARCRCYTNSICSS